MYMRWTKYLCTLPHLVCQRAGLIFEPGDLHTFSHPVVRESDQGIIDPLLHSDFDIQSVWKVADKAMMCIQPYGRLRPSMSEVLKEIMEAISIERGAELAIEGNSDTLSKSSKHSPLHACSPDLGMCKPFVSKGPYISRQTQKAHLLCFYKKGPLV